MNAQPDLWIYFALVFGIIVLPGMDMAFVATQALVGGLRAGLLAVAGILLGGVVHVAAAATGIATLLTLWPGAFNTLLVGGAAYMVWIGWSLLRASRAPLGPAGAAQRGAPQRQVFRRALLTCLMNPKAYAFTLAVFPAYLHNAERALPLQALLLALITGATQLAVYGTVALIAAGTRGFAGVGAAGQRWLLRLTGPLLMAGAALTLGFGWQNAHAAPSDEVRALEAALCRAYLRGDADAIAAGLADGYTLTDARGSVSTKADDLKVARSGSIRYTRFENRESRITLHGAHTAVVIGITRVAGRMADGTLFDVDVHFTDTYVRDKGRWRLAAGHVSGLKANRGGGMG
jgi:threonine/homoserine/homoserine lactone efflux protein/ketosteroid isomerase-like protein